MIYLSINRTKIHKFYGPIIHFGVIWRHYINISKIESILPALLYVLFTSILFRFVDAGRDDFYLLLQVLSPAPGKELKKETEKRV